VSAWHEQPVIREFAVRLDVGGAAPRDEVLDRCRQDGVNPGLPLEDDGLVVAITEQRSRADIDRLAAVLGAAMAAVRGARVGEATPA
jgi:glycine dehydrogenase subunit 1